MIIKLPENVSLVITSFNRHNSLTTLLESIHNSCSVLPNQIVVYDCSTEPLPRMIYDQCMVYEIAEDAGVSVCRNAAVAFCKNEYFVLLEDDFFFTLNTRIDLMAKAIENTGVDILGGSVSRPGRSRTDYECDMDFEKREWSKDQLLVTPAPHAKDHIVSCDAVSNFFIAKAASLRDSNTLWDPYLKCWEHIDFFLLAKRNGIKTAWLPSLVEIDHFQARPSAYKRTRINRAKQFRDCTMSKWGIDDITQADTPAVEEWLSTHDHWRIEDVC